MLKKIPVWKKVTIAILFCIVFLRVIYIMAGDEIERQYYTSAEIVTEGAQEISCSKAVQKFTSENKKLDKLELIFNGIAADQLGAVTLAITSENEILYQANISLANLNNLEWKQIFVNMPLERGRVYEICFDAKDCTQIPNLLLVPSEKASMEAVESLSGDAPLEQEIAVKYGYLSAPSMSDKLMSSLIWVLLFAAFCVLLGYFESIRDWCCAAGRKISCAEKAGVIFIVAEVLFGWVIMDCSGIEFQGPTKIIIVSLSILCAWKLKEKWEDTQKMLDKTWKKAGLCVLYFYGGFALTGYRSLIYPLDLKATVQGLFVLGIAVLWCIPVLHTIFYGLRRMSQKFVLGNGKRMKNAWFFGLLILFLLLPAIFNLYANNPGISSPDTDVSMVTNAHHLKGMRDWHPFFYCLVLKCILSVWDSTYAVILVQYFFWAYVMIEGLLYLRKKGMNDKALLAVACFSGINTSNFIHLNTIWKDIPYTLSVLWSVILLLKLSQDFEEYKGKWYIYLELIIAMLGVYFYRKNGIVTFAVTAVVLLGVLYKNVKVICTLLITVALIILVKGPLYSYYEVQDPGRDGMYIGLNQDILGVYYAGGEVSEETMKMINAATDSNIAEYNYIPTWAYQSYTLPVEPLDFIKNYLDTFIKNPVTMIRAVIARQDAVWDVFAGEGARVYCVNYTGTMDGRSVWNDYYPARSYNSFYPWMSAFTSYTASSQWISALLWRCGVFTLLGISAIFLMLCAKGTKKYLIVLAPSAGHILSLLLTTGWSDFRYFWPLNLIHMFLLLIAMTALRIKKN